MKAPVGTNVGLYYDGWTDVEEGDVIKTATTGRCYLVTDVRVQEKGIHLGRQHLRATVIDPSDVPSDVKIVPLHWYARG